MQNTRTRKRRTRERRFLLTDREDRKLEQLVGEIRYASEVKITSSSLVRAALRLLLHCEDQLVDLFQRYEIVRPRNGDEIALDGYEDVLSEILHEAIKKTPL